MGTGPSARLRTVIALPPLRPAAAGYRAPLPRACVPDRTAGRGQRILPGRHGTGTVSRRERPALPAASSTLAWTENSPARRVIATTRSTRCCGAASSRSPPACRACLRARASAATPLQSDELQACQVNDDPRLAGNGRHIRGICQVKLPAQRDDNMAVAFAGTQIHAEHREPPCFSSKAGSRPSGQFTCGGRLSASPRSRLGRVGDGAAGAALGAARAGRDVAEPRARVAGDAQQHPGVAGPDTPAHHAEDWSRFLEIYC